METVVEKLLVFIFFFCYLYRQYFLFLQKTVNVFFAIIFVYFKVFEKFKSFKLENVLIGYDNLNKLSA